MNLWKDPKSFYSTTDMFNSTHIDMKSPVNTGGINTMQCVESMQSMHNINTLTLFKLNGRGP